jgi:hypothetical protein
VGQKVVVVLRWEFATGALPAGTTEGSAILSVRIRRDADLGDGVVGASGQVAALEVGPLPSTGFSSGAGVDFGLRRSCRR